jgi:hypothetical protein
MSTEVSSGLMDRDVSSALSSMAGEMNPPCTRSVDPTLLFSCTIWLAPKGMYSATMMDTEFSVITSSSSSRMLSPPSFTADSWALCALLSVGRPPYRRHWGMYAEDT